MMNPVTLKTMIAALGCGLVQCLWQPATAAGAEAKDAPPALRIIVLDEETGKPIPSFRLIAGSDIRKGINEGFAKRTAAEAVNWQPHTAKIGNDGIYIWPLARTWKKTGLRVETDGYIPQRFTWIIKEEGSRNLEFKLKKDPGVPGKVLLPDGQPASHALIGLALIQRNVRIKDGSLASAGKPMPEKPGDRWRCPTIVETNRQGNFILTTETDPASAVVAVHPKGICEMRYADFERKKMLQLKKWGRVEGKVMIGGMAGAGLEVTLATQREGYGYPQNTRPRLRLI
jgi:hypothetical protein